MDLNKILASRTIRVLILLLLPLFNTIQGINLSIRDQFYLIDREPILIGSLEEYLKTENDRLENLQEFKDTLTKNVELYSSNDDNLAWNPLAIFKTVKYLTTDFNVIKRNIMIKNSYDDIISKIVERETFPDESHLYGAIRDVVNLQKAQRLTVLDVMNGSATHLMANASLTPEDCFYIVTKSAENHHHQTAVEWLRGCDQIFDKVQRDRAYRTLIPSTLFLGDKMLCRHVLNSLLREDYTNRIFCDLNLKLSLQLGKWNHNAEEDQWISFKTCAGDYDDEVRANQKLKCRYNHHNSPFLTIAPLKEEMVSLEPKISIFREAVYDSEIEQLFTDSYYLFRTATVVRPDNDRSLDLHYRPSQTTFLSNKQLKYVALWNRLEDMSALSLKESESFQMLHYAPGGFYRVHPDYLRATMPEVIRLGNRITTALMYLNSVQLGGNTVFPRLKLNVLPVKGSVLLWMNMRVDGSEETNVKHAACPVVYGEKKACTQWLRSGSQNHWIAEPEDDIEASYSINPNIICPKRFPSVNTTYTL